MLQDGALAGRENLTNVELNQGLINTFESPSQIFKFPPLEKLGWSPMSAKECPGLAGICPDSLEVHFPWKMMEKRAAFFRRTPKAER